MGFCPSGVLSQWGLVPVGFCPVGFCPSGVLSQWGFVLHSKGKCLFFVKLHLKSVIDINALDCNDTGSLEACIWTNRANLPVFAHFLLSFSPLSKQDTSDSRNASKFF